MFSMLLSACGDTESDDSEAAAPAEKQMAESILINNDDVVADVTIDDISGYSVHFDWSGISLIEGELKADEIMDHIHITAR